MARPIKQRNPAVQFIAITEYSGCLAFRQWKTAVLESPERTGVSRESVADANRAAIAFENLVYAPLQSGGEPHALHDAAAAAWAQPAKVGAFLGWKIG
jgi:hypothetical protein